MEAMIDQFGRVALPQEVRDRLNLTAGSSVEIEATNDEVRLKPVRPDSRLVMEGTVLVYAGGVVTPDVDDPVATDREARVQNLLPESGQ